MTQPLKPHFGSPVSGEGFFPRAYAVNLTMNTIQDGGSAALFGPRRTGKSSVMKEVSRKLTEQGLHPIEIDLQGRSGPAAFASKILSQIPKDLKNTIMTSWARLGGLPENLTQLFAKGDDASVPTDTATENLFREYWEALSDVVQAQILKSPKRIVLFLDELPYFCEEQIERKVPPRTVDDFLATLRRWRQAGISMVIAGSIGMRHVLRANNLNPDHLNDLTQIPLRPFNEAEAKLLLERLALGSTPPLTWWQDEHSQAILAEAPDLIPSYLQKAFSAARALEDRDPAALRETLRRDVRSDFVSGFFDQFNKRLGRYKDQAVSAQAVLKLLLDGPKQRVEIIAALQASGIATDYEAGEFLQEMIEDSFIAPGDQDGTFQLAYRMVESWWKQRS